MDPPLSEAQQETNNGRHLGPRAVCKLMVIIHRIQRKANFLEYFPIVPAPDEYGNRATSYALGRGAISLKTSRRPVVLKRDL